MSRLVLGIETSCDDTSAAVVVDGTCVLSNVIASQVDFHRRFGGVVPEIASRKHLELCLPVIDEALSRAGVSAADLDLLAVTCGPGLAGALLVGVSAAKAMAWALDRPFIGVNHLEGHIEANFLDGAPRPEGPAVCLVVSGGHTDLVAMMPGGGMALLGHTRDDAAGEAFDKVARAMGLGYPGGPQIDRLAKEGDPEAFRFPRAYLEEDSLDFSFSGLKTAVQNRIASAGAEDARVEDLAASFQRAVVEVLVDKTAAAARRTGARTVYLAGGVAANSELREAMKQRGKEEGFEVRYPPPVYCTDNAAMIAAAGYRRFTAGERSGLDLNADADLDLFGGEDR